MPRLPYAMRTLVSEIRSVIPSAEFEFADVDGFGVYRTLQWDDRTAAKIREAFNTISSDQRIVASTSTSATFSASTLSDNPAEFHLAAVAKVLEDSERRRKAAERAARKAPAKKVAAAKKKA